MIWKRFMWQEGRMYRGANHSSWLMSSTSACSWVCSHSFSSRDCRTCLRDSRRCLFGTSRGSACFTPAAPILYLPTSTTFYIFIERNTEIFLWVYHPAIAQRSPWRTPLFFLLLCFKGSSTNQWDQTCQLPHIQVGGSSSKLTHCALCHESSCFHSLSSERISPYITFSLGTKNSLFNSLSLSDLLQKSKIVRVSVPVTANCTIWLPNMQAVCKRAASSGTCLLLCPHLPMPHSQWDHLQ